jgi:5-methylcytosine-specific restriction endonuclease McrA
MTQQPLQVRVPIKATPFDWTRLATADALDARLEPSDPSHRFMFRIAEGSLDLYWGGYEYSIELDRVNTPARLLASLSHILAKDWEYASSRRICLLIRALERHFDWSLLSSSREPPRSRTTSAAEERAKLTPSLRYDVLLRDDFRCRACGFSVESGAHLHIDHIKPVSKGGTTEIHNLQALCSTCNLGKGSRA